MHFQESDFASRFDPRLNRSNYLTGAVQPARSVAVFFRPEDVFAPCLRLERLDRELFADVGESRNRFTQGCDIDRAMRGPAALPGLTSCRVRAPMREPDGIRLWSARLWGARASDR